MCIDINQWKRSPSKLDSLYKLSGFYFMMIDLISLKKKGIQIANKAVSLPNVFIDWTFNE